jgi:hypothetical protein
MRALPSYYSATAQEATLHNPLSMQRTHAPAYKYGYNGLLRRLTLIKRSQLCDERKEPS